jgi:transposase
MTEEKKKQKPKQKPVFKEYIMGQMMLLPVDLEDEIESDHLVRVVHAAVEKMDLSVLYEQYKGGGTSSYHPKMMLKVLIYAYTQQIYTSRKIAKALRENIYFMWLSGNSHPDFHTINRFRSEILKESICEVFVAVLTLLSEGGYIKLEDYFVDGTKLEANANKYSFVWAKNTKRYKEGVQQKVVQLLEQIEELNAVENAELGERDLPERGGTARITAEQLEQRIRELNERLNKLPQADDSTKPAVSGTERVSEISAPESVPDQAGKTGEELSEPQSEKKVDKRKRQKSKNQQLAKGVKQLAENYLPRLKKYEEQEAILGKRNSYSKIDEDATFMRMKEDHMLNGQLKAGYNIQMGTEGQFVVGYTVHQRPGDPGCLIPHLQEVKQQLGRLPKNITADSAYGSEENYVYLEAEGVNAYVKYNTFHQETKPRHKPNPFAIEQMPYDELQDAFTCPNGKQLRYKATHRYRTDNGYESQRRLYECEDCSECPLKTKCTKAKGNRQAKVSFKLWQLRDQANQMLVSEKGKALRAQRSIDVETVFGRIKQDWGFRRFLLRGLGKVKIEWGLICIAHNLTKLALV